MTTLYQQAYRTMLCDVLLTHSHVLWSLTPVLTWFCLKKLTQSLDFFTGNNILQRYVLFLAHIIFEASQKGRALMFLIRPVYKE